MSAITSILSIDLINPAEGSKSTPTSPLCIDIAIQHPYQSGGEVIAASVPLQPLKETTPALLEYLITEGTEIVLPRSEAIDWSLLLHLIDDIIGKHCSGDIFEIDTHEALQDPVKAIKLHIILQLFGLSHQFDRLAMQLRETFTTHTLTLTDVFWMYGALVPPKDIKWMPELTEWYLDLLASNILNADAENRLHRDVRAFFLEDEGRPYRITRLLEEHFNKYALNFEELSTPEVVSRKRRDTATERTDIIELSPFRAPSPPSPPASKKSPILPAKWLAITRPKRLQKPVDIDVGFSHSKSAGEEWDGKSKNVREMIGELQSLVTLRRKQLYPEHNKESVAYKYGIGFRYEGWCDDKDS